MLLHLLLTHILVVMTHEESIEVASLWGTLSKADKDLICKDNAAFCMYLSKYYRELNLYYCNDVMGRDTAAVMIVAKPMINSIVCFTRPDCRKSGCQKYLMTQLKRDYAGQELHVKIHTSCAYGWHDFWHQNGFNLFDNQKNWIEYVWDGKR